MKLKLLLAQIILDDVNPPSMSDIEDLMDCDNLLVCLFQNVCLSLFLCCSFLLFNLYCPCHCIGPIRLRKCKGCRSLNSLIFFYIITFILQFLLQTIRLTNSIKKKKTIHLGNKEKDQIQARP